MTIKEIEGAVKIVKEHKNSSLDFNSPDMAVAISALLSLAQQVLAMGEPKERPIKKFNANNWRHEGERIENELNNIYNQALHDKNLWLAKQLLGLEKVLWIEIRGIACNGTTDCENSPECVTDDGCLPEDIAKSIVATIRKDWGWDE